MKKICNTCHIEKDLNEFYKDKNNKDGHRYVCKECDKKRKQKYKKGPFKVKCIICGKEYYSRLSNGKFCSKECKKKYDLERYREYSKTEKCKKAKEKYSKTEKRKIYIREYNKEKMKTDINFRLNSVISGAIYKHLKNNNLSKNNHWEEVIEQNFEEIKQHLESQFDDKMSWDNYGSYWQIDHIIPKSLYDIKDEEELKKCWNKNNLRPLEKSLNNKKKDTLDLSLVEEYKIKDLLPHSSQLPG